MEVYLSRGRTLKYQITVCEQVPADSEIYQIEKGTLETIREMKSYCLPVVQKQISGLCCIESCVDI